MAGYKDVKNSNNIVLTTNQSRNNGIPGNTALLSDDDL